MNWEIVSVTRKDERNIHVRYRVGDGVVNLDPVKNSFPAKGPWECRMSFTWKDELGAYVHAKRILEAAYGPQKEQLS